MWVSNRTDVVAAIEPVLYALSLHVGIAVPLPLVAVHIAALRRLDAPFYTALTTEAQARVFSALCDVLHHVPTVALPGNWSAAASLVVHFPSVSTL